MSRVYRYEIFADYYQFYLQDDDPDVGDLSEALTKEATEHMLAVAPHVIGVRTVLSGNVAVSVTVHASRPNIHADDWDHITRASLQVNSGRIVIAGCTDYFPDAARMEVTPGVYEVIVCYGRLASVSPDGLAGEDSYHVHLFPGKMIEPMTIKNRWDR